MIFEVSFCMKKHIAAILIFAIIACLVGCNSVDQPLGEASATTEQNELNTHDTESVPTQSAETTDISETTIPANGENESTNETSKPGQGSADNEEINATTPTEKPTSPTTPPTEAKPETTTPPTTDNDKETEPTEIPATMELKKIGNLQYYLYSPKNPTKDMPLIIYLHGGTNKKADVTALLTTDGFPKWLNDGYYGDLRAFVAIPKLENSYKGWADIYEPIRNLVKDLNKNYNISMSKVALTGHSMGGTGAYQLQVKLPNTFACVAPMSGSIANTEANLAALSKTKIWAFVGTDDTIVDPESSRVIISVLQDSGANAKITELNGATHFDVPSLAYKNKDLIQWLVRCGK